MGHLPFFTFFYGIIFTANLRYTLKHSLTKIFPPPPLTKLEVLDISKICTKCLTCNTQHCSGGGGREGSTWITFSSPETQIVPSVLTRIVDILDKNARCIWLSSCCKYLFKSPTFIVLFTDKVLSFSMNLTRIDMLSPGVLLVLGLCESGMLSSRRQGTPSVVLSIWGMLALLTWNKKKEKYKTKQTNIC